MPLMVADSIDPDVQPGRATSLGTVYNLCELSVPICEMGMMIPVPLPGFCEDQMKRRIQSH